MSEPDWKIFRVGLTGGIASGKSTVAELFAAHGVPVIDTDQIARQLVEPGEPALSEITAVFSDVLDDTGQLDRRKLRERVFAEDACRRQLEAILHPRIRQATLAHTHRSGGPYQLIVVPLLLESGFHRLVNRVLVVDCPEALQRKRLQQRDRDIPEQIDRILAAQAARADRLAAADDVIDNSGSLAATRRQVAALHRLYLALARDYQGQRPDPG